VSRALLLLDVDGPLNPCEAKAHRRPHGYETFRLRPSDLHPSEKPFRVWLAPEHGPMLRRFAEQHDLEMVWATTWQHDANTMIGPKIGLPELPVIEFKGLFNSDAWKWAAVADYADGRPLVWFDDDFALPWHSRAATVFQQVREGLPTLLHRVDPRIGLTVLDLNQAGRWLDRVIPRNADETS
jgi:hypothetical protein